MSTDEVARLSQKIDGIAEEVGEIRVVLARFEERQAKESERDRPSLDCEKAFASLYVSKAEFESLFLQAAEAQGNRSMKKIQLFQIIVSMAMAFSSGGVIVAIVKIAQIAAKLG